MEFVSADIQRLLTGIAGTVAQSAGRLALALVGGFILARVLRMLLVQLERVLVRAGERTGALAAVTRSRVATLTSVLRTLALVVLWSVVAVICPPGSGSTCDPSWPARASWAWRWASGPSTWCAT